METIKLTKMQGLGNDFVIIDFSEFQKSGLEANELAKRVCDRNFGVGADGMIIPAVCEDKDADISWFFYNSDGTTAQMCGNGMRCFAKYVYDRKIINRKKFTVRTLAGIIEPEILEDGFVRVNMGKPVLREEKVPFLGKFGQKLAILDREFVINPVSMGNPHCVIFVEETDLQKLYNLAADYGATIERSELFPEKTNVEFVAIKGKNEVDMRVWERGCGITLACGTGACATVVAAILNNLTESKVRVNLLGGALTIEWQGSSLNSDFNVFMTGSADYVFSADYLL